MYFNFGVWLSIMCGLCAETQTEIFRHLVESLDKNISSSYDDGRVTRFKKCAEELPKISRGKKSKSIVELMDAKDFVSFSDDFFDAIAVCAEDKIKNSLLEMAMVIINDESIDNYQILIEHCTYVADCKENICKARDFINDCYHMLIRPLDVKKMQRMIFGCLQFAYSRQNKIKNNIYTVDKHLSPTVRFKILYKDRYQKVVPNSFDGDFALEFVISEQMQKIYNDISSIFDTAYPFSQGRVVLLSDVGSGGSNVSEMCAKINSKRFHSGVFWVGCNDGIVKLVNKITGFLCSVNIEVLDSTKLHSTFLNYFNEREADGRYKHNKWLIVFDDVNDELMYHYISKLLPENPHGSVLITSTHRDLDWSKIAENNILCLDSPSEKDSMRYLLHRIDIYFRNGIIPIAFDKYNEAQDICTEIVRRLGCNRNTIKYVAEHLFNTYVMSCLGDAYSEYSMKYDLKEAYFKHLEMQNEEQETSILPALREFAEKLKQGKPIWLNHDKDGKRVQIYNHSGVYKDAND